MKRGFSQVSSRHDGLQSTPLLAKPPLNKKAGVKKQKTIRAFLTVETPRDGVSTCSKTAIDSFKPPWNGPTPHARIFVMQTTTTPKGAGELVSAGKSTDWPSSCQRAFEKFGIDTPTGVHSVQVC